MEIDLNHDLGEEEKAACVDGEESEKGEASPPQSSMYLELWHACSGPLTSLPKKGNVVVYFPQGHMEQAASASPFPPMEMPTLDLPPQIFCRVLDVKLLASKENDEVYTQLHLLPLPELVGVKLEGKENENSGFSEDRNGVVPAKSTSHMFCKTLTASDTSTHGGFSVPRRAAEDCFPPLDYKEQRPSQELIAKDLHGVEWKFRHIYRGQPRRHLLTTGWSIFVSQKNLVSGDAVLFLRGEGGDLHLGIRRAARPINGLPDSIIKNQSSYPNVLAPVANALSTHSPFSAFYSPREGHNDFIVPYEKYDKCMASHIPAGTRFKMRFDFDDSPERRLSGVVTGVSDIDPYRWPNSKWRCLMVRWDEDIMNNHRERVSPWDIDFSGRGALFDFEESMRSSKVLQGQENVGLVSPLYRSDRVTGHLDFEKPNSAPNSMEKIKYGEFIRSHAPTTFTGYLESNWFPKVLQGQEICSLRSLAGKADPNFGLAWSKPELGYNVYNNPHQRPVSTPSPSFYPLASEGARNITIPHKGIFRAGAAQGPLVFSSFPSYPTGNHVLSGATADMSRAANMVNEPIAMENSLTPQTSVLHFKSDDDSKEKAPTCKLFGISLMDDPGVLALQGLGKRSCTKVHKQGSLVGRAIDLSRLHGYDDLLGELERLFSMEGLLRDPNYGWRILYTDSESDMMVVGDDPWRDFVDVVTKIHIYTQEEVEKLSLGMNSDDTKSCLEEAPPAPDASSVGQPEDSSPTRGGM
ncbi:auxin response factor 4 isoform X2 [Andrographis paniculata]|uniref:auxin response factor 4 isoform X2 n=1 Tax=Andrographis paniculata TaxID=175694 RepID=UPI0021E7B079|nr:auxin response factor 4 isoform X2 [Andrographis paniculata]